MDHFLNRNGYEDLADAIVIKAAIDYRSAYKRYKKGDDLALARIKEVERFFNSKWGDYLCSGNAKDILWRLQEEQKEKPPKPRRTVKITTRGMQND